jgi:hypothetical protein
VIRIVFFGDLSNNQRIPINGDDRVCGFEGRICKEKCGFKYRLGGLRDVETYIRVSGFSVSTRTTVPAAIMVILQSHG